MVPDWNPVAYDRSMLCISLVQHTNPAKIEAAISCTPSYQLSPSCITVLCIALAVSASPAVIAIFVAGGGVGTTMRDRKAAVAAEQSPEKQDRSCSSFFFILPSSFFLHLFLCLFIVRSSSSSLLLLPVSYTFEKRREGESTGWPTDRRL